MASVSLLPTPDAHPRSAWPRLLPASQGQPHYLLKDLHCHLTVGRGHGDMFTGSEHLHSKVACHFWAQTAGRVQADSLRMWRPL